jgi:pimeloyl-ACP methyl ester carboxylesterase
MLWWEDGFCRLLAGRGRFLIRYDHRDTGRSTTYEPGPPGYTGADLLADAVAVLEAEEAATPLLQPGMYLEPFALRTLGIARSDRTLTEQAVERFETMGLRWHAAKTRALAPA